MSGSDIFWQGDTSGFEDRADEASCLGSQDDGITVVFDGHFLQAIEVTQDVLPFGLDAGFFAAGLKFLSEDRGEKGAKDVAANGGVTGMIDRPGFEQRLGASKELLDLKKVTIAQHGLEWRDLGLLWQAQDEDAIEPLNASRAFSIGELAGIDLEGGFGLLVSARRPSEITPVGGIADQRLVTLFCCASRAWMTA